MTTLQATTSQNYKCTICRYVREGWAPRCSKCSTINSLKVCKKCKISADTEKGFHTVRSMASDGDGESRFVQDSYGSIHNSMTTSNPMSQEPIRDRSMDLDEVVVDDTTRVSTGIDLIDEAFGDDTDMGVEPGAAILFSGSPGAGKSTLLAQIGGFMSRGGVFLYGSGEESVKAVKKRALRCGALAEASSRKNFKIVETKSWEELEVSLRNSGAKLFVMDSVSVFKTSEVSGMPGGVRQMKQLGIIIKEYCKQTDSIAFLVCHITKSGSAAGPKALEHEVDVVCKIDKTKRVRRFSVSKNRMGNTEFEPLMKMTSRGLIGIDPTEEKAPKPKSKKQVK